MSASLQVIQAEGARAACRNTEFFRTQEAKQQIHPFSSRILSQFLAVQASVKGNPAAKRTAL